MPRLSSAIHPTAAQAPATPLAVVVVSFNTREHLRACLETIAPEPAARVVVADNGSADGSVEMARRTFPSVELDVDAANPGYGAGANRAIRRCGDADVLLLNSDTRLAPGALTALATYLAQHPRAGVVGPRLTNPDGTLQRSTFPFPSPLRPPLRTDPFAHVVGRVPVLRHRYLATWPHDRPRVVPYVMGAALAIRRRAFEAVGGFDESFFMYAEEVDLCWRMRAGGWETHFAPVTEVVHEGCASTSQRRAAMLERSVRSSMQFYERHYGGTALRLATAILRAGVRLRWMRDTLGAAVTRDCRSQRRFAENREVWRRTLHYRPPGNVR